MIGDAMVVGDFPGVPYSASPTCYLCHNDKRDDDPGVLNTLVDELVEAGSPLYFCFRCVEFMATLIGLADRATITELRAKNVELGRNNRSLGGQLKAVLRQLEAEKDRREVAEERLKA